MSLPSIHEPIDAYTIAKALGGKRYGKGWRACCPAHGGSNPTSLSVTDGNNGLVLVHCFGGCTQTEVIAELACRGLWPKSTPEHRQYIANRQQCEKIKHAETILFLADGDDESTWSDKDRADIAAASKLLGLPEPNNTIIRPESSTSNGSWLFKFHCTTLRGVALNFIALEGDAKAVTFFNSAIKSPRGKPYPTGIGGQFIPPKSGKFRKFWMNVVDEEPYRWSLVHRHMKKVFAGLVFTGETVTAFDSKGNSYLKLTDLRLK